jgi:hypothetical protein
MAARKAARNLGYEPAKGFPDPAIPPADPAVPVSGQYTHYPHSNGAVCNAYPVPTDAGAYDPVDPTCPLCAKWLKAATAQTYARHPWLAPPPPTTPKPAEGA